MKSGEIKMDVEPQTSNDLIASNSTKYSNNTKNSIELNNINFYFSAILAVKSEKFDGFFAAVFFTTQE